MIEVDRDLSCDRVDRDHSCDREIFHLQDEVILPTKWLPWLLSDHFHQDKCEQWSQTDPDPPLLTAGGQDDISQCQGGQLSWGGAACMLPQQQNPH